VPPVRHPFHPTLRIPATFVALRDFILDGTDGTDVFMTAWRKVENFFCGDLHTYLLADEPADGPADRPGHRFAHGELGYRYQPVEIVPFCRGGVDGLHYGWAVLAPELDLADQVCVSFAPVDDDACWLGDTTHEALENLLAGHLLSWRQWNRDGEPPPDEDPRWRAVCDALGLHPVGDGITAGARSDRAIRPVVPPGWHYEPSVDGIGVLAPASAFAPVPVEPENWDDVEERTTLARRLLADGHPASVVDLLKSTAPERSDLLLMRDAYRALRRDLHVERATIWLDRH
jgi:hypothetical protein